MAAQGPDHPDTTGRPYAPVPSRPRPPRRATSPLAEMLDWVRGRLVVAGRGLLLLGLAVTGLALVLAVLGVLGVVALLAWKATDPNQTQELDLIAAMAVLVFWLLLAPVF